MNKCTICIAILAIFLGALYSGILAKTGIFTILDDVDFGRGPEFKGLIPAVHKGDWGFSEEEMPDLQGHTSVITGANVGLGYWTAYHIAKAGGRVILACRTDSKCQKAASELKIETSNEDIYPLSLDLASFESIQTFSAEFLKRYESLDSLVLNAGVMGPPFMKTKEGLELQIGTNHFGHHLLTKLLMPALERAAEKKGVATVVVVSSSAHYTSYPEGVHLSIDALNDESRYRRHLAYGQSKLANVLFSQELASRVSDKGILVNSLHPGAVDTELTRHASNVARKFVGDTGANLLRDYVLPSAKRGFWHPKTAALTQVYAAVSEKLKKEKISGKYFHPIARQTKPDPHTFNSTLQKGLWEMTEAFICEHTRDTTSCII